MDKSQSLYWVVQRVTEGATFMEIRSFRFLASDGETFRSEVSFENVGEEKGPDALLRMYGWERGGYWEELVDEGVPVRIAVLRWIGDPVMGTP
jgi:hypothetical protein